jgi:hypothetical protein
MSSVGLVTGPNVKGFGWFVPMLAISVVVRGDGSCRCTYHRESIASVSLIRRISCSLGVLDENRWFGKELGESGDSLCPYVNPRCRARSGYTCAFSGVYCRSVALARFPPLKCHVQITPLYRQLDQEDYR